MTYAFTHMGNFLLLLLLLLLYTTPSPRPISQPGGPYSSLEAQIPVLRPKSHSQGPNPNPKAQILVSRDLGLKTGIWALRLGSGPPGLDMGLEAGGEGGAEKEKRKKEKIPNMCESIGHRLLWGSCPAPPSASTTTYLSRARVPLTI